MFSINGTVNRPAGTAAINKTLIIYLDMYVTVVGKLGRNTIQVKFLVGSKWICSFKRLDSKTAKTNYTCRKTKNCNWEHV
jgi:hypothetical protein